MLTTRPLFHILFCVPTCRSIWLLNDFYVPTEYGFCVQAVYRVRDLRGQGHQSQAGQAECSIAGDPIEITHTVVKDHKVMTPCFKFIIIANIPMGPK